MKIGELASATATKVETVRYYEKIGLLPPPARTSANYRAYVGQESVTRSLTINGLLANRSKSISDQRRALLLPQELMQFPTDRLLLLRGGIPPILGTKIFYYKSRFFKSRAFPSPIVPPLERHIRAAMAPPSFRDMTDEEAEGNPAHPLTQDDIRTEDYPSFCADLLTLDRDGNASIIIEEGDENG